MILFTHIAGGALGLVAGYVALYSTKGAPLHRRSGAVFASTMLATAALGFILAIVRQKALSVNLPTALLMATLVSTSWTTVRPLQTGARWFELLALLVTLGVGTASLSFALQAIANGGSREGIPLFPFLLLGVPAMLAAAGDLRVLRSGPMAGRARLARHLWRMCFALFLAGLAVFPRLGRLIPKQEAALEPLLMLPMAAVLLTMIYWLWRVRPRRSARFSAKPRIVTA